MPMPAPAPRHPITVKARQLRANQTQTEQHLWHHLRGKQLGVAFRRQYPVGHYIADFACVDLKLILELDGGQHANQAAYDFQRDQWLRMQGYEVLRFWDNDVLQKTEAVLEMIWQKVQDLSAVKGSPSQPPPQVGEE